MTAAQPQRRWADCPMCAAYYDANRSAVIHAAASVGIERGLTTNQALALYMKERHARHA
jgi:hypothetical protein